MVGHPPAAALRTAACRLLLLLALPGMFPAALTAADLAFAGGRSDQSSLSFWNPSSVLDSDCGSRIKGCDGERFTVEA